MITPSFVQQTALRLLCFFGVLATIMLWEVLAPRRRLGVSRKLRWTSNLSLVAVNSILLRLVFPVAAVGVAVMAQKESWGLLNNLPINFWLKVIITVIFFDFIIYLQHVVFHLVPFLWRFHKMHHTDLDFDTTTGLRFHPVEILLSMLLKITIVLLFGLPAIGVFIFEVLLNATAMFNHGNVRMPVAVDRYLRLFVVTPDMHRVHHSIIWEETNSNYGFNLPWWDRLCRTYIKQPKEGHERMVIGIRQFRGKKYLKINWLLAIPFIKPRS